MQRVRDEQERIAAVPHDAVEDTNVTMAWLAEAGFYEPALEAVAALTKLSGESRLDAASRAAVNRVARVVKLADDAENMDLSRIANPSERDIARMEECKDVRRLLLVKDDA